jgi:hypothetical protein
MPDASATVREPRSAAAQTKPRPKRRGFSRPELHIQVTLHSTHAQRVAGRNMLEVARALYTIAVILHVIGDQDKADQVEEIVAGKIRALSEKLQTQLKSLRGQREDAGITQFPVYRYPLKMTLRISSPELAQYASLIQALDALSVETDTLWLSGLITNRQHANVAYQWRRELLRLADEITRIEAMARTSAASADAAQEIAERTEEARGVVTIDEGGELDLADEESEATA